MLLTKFLPTWALLCLITFSVGSDIFGAAQVSAPAMITQTPSGSDLKTTDGSTLTQPPNIATASPIALPTTTSTTTVGGYMLLILPPEPVSYNTTNYTTSTTTMFVYSQPSSVPSASGVPNATYPSPKQVKDLAEIIFPSVLGGVAVVGGLTAWGIGYYLWRDFQRAVTDFPETNLEKVTTEFIEVARAKSWQESVKRKKQMERYRRMAQMESFVLKQERKKRGTRFTKAQWLKFKEGVTPHDQTFDAPPPKDCVVLCPERVPRTPSPPPQTKNPNTRPGILKTSKPLTQPSNNDQTLTTQTQDPWKIFKTTTKTSDSKGKGKATARNTDTDYKPSKTVDPDTLTTPTQKRTSKTPTKTSDSKGKGKATARDTDTDYKSNWYSKTVAYDTPTTTTRRRTLNIPRLTQTPPSSHTTPPSSHTTPPPPSQTATSSHHPKPPRPLLTEVPHSPLPHRAHCRGLDWRDCCIYIRDLQVMCFPY